MGLIRGIAGRPESSDWWWYAVDQLINGSKGDEISPLTNYGHGKSKRSSLRGIRHLLTPNWTDKQTWWCTYTRIRWWFLKSCSPLPISGEIIQFDPICFHFESKHQPLHRHVWLGFPRFLLTGSKPKRPELLMLLGTLRDTNGTTKTYKIVLWFLLFCL